MALEWDDTGTSHRQTATVGEILSLEIAPNDERQEWDWSAFDGQGYLIGSGTDDGRGPDAAKLAAETFARTWIAAQAAALGDGPALHVGTVLRIIRHGREGNMQALEAYAGLLADKLEADGEIESAKRVRRTAAGDYGLMLHLMEEGVSAALGDGGEWTSALPTVNGWYWVDTGTVVGLETTRPRLEFLTTVTALDYWGKPFQRWSVPVEPPPLPVAEVGE